MWNSLSNQFWSLQLCNGDTHTHNTTRQRSHYLNLWWVHTFIFSNGYIFTLLLPINSTKRPFCHLSSSLNLPSSQEFAYSLPLYLSLQALLCPSMAHFLRVATSSLLLMITLFLSLSEAKEIIIGGKTDAWKIPSSQSDSLNKWAESSRFRIGDTLGISTQTWF